PDTNVRCKPRLSARGTGQGAVALDPCSLIEPTVANVVATMRLTSTSLCHPTCFGIHRRR
ncbi:MAG: hypothetical protein J2P17_35540, partial [Mycobacterium sp.]|nr:hypothetical protein [Mycobacterium sp.]